MKRIFAVVVAAPILALFVGVGTLAFSIAGTWDERNTDEGRATLASLQRDGLLRWPDAHDLVDQDER